MNFGINMVGLRLVFVLLMGVGSLVLSSLHCRMRQPYH